MSVSRHLRAFLLVVVSLFSNVTFAAASPFHIIERPQTIDDLTSVANKYLADSLQKPGRPSPQDVVAQSQFTDEQHHGHVRYQQFLRGVPVLGSEAIVHVQANGALENITNNLQNFLDVDTQPQITAANAQKIALASYGCILCLTAAPQVELFVVRLAASWTGDIGLGENTVDALAYRVQLKRIDGSDKTAMPTYFVDAHTGLVLFNYDNLKKAEATGSGTSLYSGTVTLNTFETDGTFYLEDHTRKLGTFDYRRSMSRTYRITDADNTWDATAQKAAVDAHYGSAMVYDYYLTKHDRRGIDGSGGPGYFQSIDGTTPLITSLVHYGRSYDNAFWDGYSMTYGDGNGVDSGPLVTLDITAHEMTHGVTERSSNLGGYGEPGALNESWSDVFGAMVERHAHGESANTWMLGEDCITPAIPGDAMRYMNEPQQAGDPDHYSLRQTSGEDDGGVHTNSTIASHAFYLLAKGGKHRLGGEMTGIGADDAAKIWYKANTTYMTSNTNFTAARKATLSAASALFGATSTQYYAVSHAWALVGVGADLTPSGDDAPTEDPVPPVTTSLQDGDFEDGSSVWVTSGDARVVASGNYPHSGSAYVGLGAVNNAAGTAYQSFTVPVSSELRFWLNVVSNESGGIYDKLFVEIVSATGELLKTLATYSNEDSATSGTYVQKGPFDLSAYSGQNIRLQFRVANDASKVTTFRVDDITLE
jgi:Zn-dependent metalloprotease